MEEIILTEEDLEEILPLNEDAYVAFELEPDWGEDSELLEQWFEAGEQLADDTADWVYWVDLYKDHVDRTDLIVHWLRCLFDPELPRPRQLEQAA